MRYFIHISNHGFQSNQVLGIWEVGETLAKRIDVTDSENNRIRSSSSVHNVSLAGGTRTKGTPSFHAAVAITARRPGALLTGLATALAHSLSSPVSRDELAPRRNDNGQNETARLA
ncbi:hypothetical protein [Bradyrhizobium sp. SZCCHNRI3042]|uniref:hypothetical protein n=1 Tax=Bradyrhizobium sp. SZCCHNRI3042 TaxID=3057291 RepID=UPI002916E861|nr:hypothetical protein [Bradyrhizobium sp. SZCCHNRI3042]